MIALDLGKKTFPLPENWSDVQRLGKFADVVTILYSCTNNNEAKLVLLNKLCGIDGHTLASAFNAGTPQQRNELSEKIDWFVGQQIVEECLPVLEFIFEPGTIEHNPIPVLSIGRHLLYGPTDRLAKQTGAEMEATGHAYSEFLKTQDEKHLHALIAAMYRPRKWLLFGNVEAYDEARAEQRLPLIAKLPAEVKRAILFYYESCENWWMRMYEHLYTPSAPPVEGAEPPPIDSLANVKIIRSLAGTKRGTVNDVRLMSRDEIYFELTELDRERQEIEDQIKK